MLVDWLKIERREGETASMLVVEKYKVEKMTLEELIEKVEVVKGKNLNEMVMNQVLLFLGLCLQLSCYLFFSYPSSFSFYLDFHTWLHK